MEVKEIQTKKNHLDVIESHPNIKVLRNYEKYVRLFWRFILLASIGVMLYFIWTVVYDSIDPNKKDESLLRWNNTIVFVCLTWFGILLFQFFMTMYWYFMMQSAVLGQVLYSGAVRDMTQFYFLKCHIIATLDSKPFNDVISISIQAVSLEQAVEIAEISIKDKFGEEAKFDISLEHSRPANENPDSSEHLKPNS